MRTQSVVDKITAQARIILSAKQQQLALQAQDNVVSGDVIEDAYDEFFAVSNVLYALQFKSYFSLYDQNILCDFLVRRGYTFIGDSMLFSEGIYNDQTFDIIN